MNEPRPLSADALAEQEMHKRAAKRDSLAAEGWSRLMPAQGAAVWNKGDEYLDATGEPCTSPEMQASSDPVAECKERAHDLIDDMGAQDVATFMMGDELDGRTLQAGLTGTLSAQTSFIDQYSDIQVKSYLVDTAGLTVGDNVQRSAMNQMLMQAVNNPEPVSDEDAAAIVAAQVAAANAEQKRIDDEAAEKKAEADKIAADEKAADEEVAAAEKERQAADAERLKAQDEADAYNEQQKLIADGKLPEANQSGEAGADGENGNTEPVDANGLTAKQTDAVYEAIGQLVEETPDKKPNVDLVEGLIGFDISAAQRDVVWDQFQAAQDA